MSELTSKQEKFCLAYLETGNASEAYRRAYSASKMKDKTVWEQASVLLADRKVAARVAALRSIAAEKACVSEARTLEEAARIALFDPGELFGSDGALLPIHLMAASTRAAIASIEVVEDIGQDGAAVGRVKKIKLWDKNSALEKLMKHLGMYEKDNKQRNGIFDDVPRDTVKIIEEKLRAMSRSGLAGSIVAGSQSRFTH